MAITNEQSEPEVRTVGEKQPYDFSKKKKNQNATISAYVGNI